MSKPFDATTKDLIRNHPKDWLDFLGLPARSVTVSETDLSTISADADKILIADADPPYAANLEIQSNYKLDDAERFMFYSVLAGRQTGLHVRTVVFLLRPAADGPCMRTELQHGFPEEPPYLQFRFRVVRLWEQSAAAFLSGGIGLLPFVPLCNISQ